MRTAIAPAARDSRQAMLAPVLLAQWAEHIVTSTAEVSPEAIAAIVRVCCPHLADEGERMRLWGEYLDAVRQEIGADRTGTAADVAVETSKRALEALTGRQS